MALTGSIKSGGGGGGGSVSTLNSEKSFTQVAHGFAAGSAVYFNGSWAKAQADATSTLCEGLVTAVADADNFTVCVPGGAFMTLTAHGLGAAGSPLYLSESAVGELTTTPPATGYVQTIGQIIDADTISVQSFSAVPA